MKKHSSHKTLNFGWRDFSSPEIKSEINSAEVISCKKKTNTKITPISNVVKNKSGGIKLPGLSKFHNNISKIAKKFSNNNKSSFRSVEAVYSGAYSLAGLDMQNRDVANKVHKFDEAYGMSRINMNPAMPGKYDLKSVRDRRIAANFARVMSKIAEDNVGGEIEGDDFWDVNRIMSRKISKESILKCRMSREKRRIVSLLDSSPSCSDYSNFYSKMAVVAAEYGDVEMYDAPNGHIVHRWSLRKKRFERFLTPQDILAGVSQWSLFRNRVVVIFSDYDAAGISLKNTIHNKVYYFCTEYGADHATSHIYNTARRITKNMSSVNTKNLVVYSGITNTRQFAKTAKKMK